jgi:hypothetical protein
MIQGQIPVLNGPETTFIVPFVVGTIRVEDERPTIVGIIELIHMKGAVPRPDELIFFSFDRILTPAQSNKEETDDSYYDQDFFYR